VEATAEIGVAAVTAEVQEYGGTAWLSFDVPVTITNAGDEPLRVATCAHTVEQPTGADWKTVWRPICQTGEASDVVIPAGEAREVTFHIGASLSASAAPQWEAIAVEGTYRLRIGFVPLTGGGAIPTVASSTFVLAES
jgi:hypothetical protein